MSISGTIYQARMQHCLMVEAIVICGKLEGGRGGAGMGKERARTDVVYETIIVLSPGTRSSIKNCRNVGVGFKLTRIQLSSRQINLGTDGYVALRWSLKVVNSFTPIWVAWKGLRRLCAVLFRSLDLLCLPQPLRLCPTLTPERELALDQERGL